jgi:hypothetical protein
MPLIMIVFTLKREVEAIVDEYQDWREEGIEILFHSRTSKCDDAFIVIKWNKPIPDKFKRKLMNDDDIMDYIIIEA